MVVGLLSERSRVFDNSDPLKVSAYVNQHVGNHRIVLPAASESRATLSHRRLAGVDLCHISYGTVTRVTCTALRDTFHVQIMLSGSCLQLREGQQRKLLAGELMVINPGEPVDLTYSPDCEKFILKLPVALLETVCKDQRWTYPQEGLGFAGRVYASGEMRELLSLLSLICHEVESENTSVVVHEHYVQILTRKLLTCLVSNVQRAPLMANERSFRRVVMYIDEHVKDELSPESLANIANMSIRSLYVMFEQRMGETPRRYVLRKKLERIKAALLDPLCPVSSITELALDYGFSHLGRFAGDYKALFCELPSRTLARR